MSDSPGTSKERRISQTADPTSDAIDPGNDVGPLGRREDNMRRRRARILESARDLIAEGGFDALNLRDLALRAEVTVPTVYNLIGRKEELLQVLFEGSLKPFENIRLVTDREKPFNWPESLVDRIVAVVRENENYYRAEYLARRRLEKEGDVFVTGLLARAVQVAAEACRESVDVGLLRGDLHPEQLGGQIYSCLRFAYARWARAEIDLATLRREVLTGTYICLAADVRDEFREQLVARLASLRSAG